jgi:adenylate cyclase
MRYARGIMATEIERRFIVHGTWPEGDAIERVWMQQGYMPTGRACTVRLRRTENMQLLTVKEGAGLTRTESEIPLSPEQFDTLWPHTQAHRIEKVRCLLPQPAGTFEVDQFAEPFSGITIAELEFATEAEAWNARLPHWCGEEITGLVQFANSSMARHGYPKTPQACTGTPFKNFRLGAMPYRFGDDGLELLLVTARSGGHWILPKGMPEVDLTRAETAALEAFEEGGVEGQIDPNTCRACPLHSGEICLVFPLEVETVVPKKKWHEASIRQREWLPIEKACQRVSPGYIPAIRNLAAAIENT